MTSLARKTGLTVTMEEYMDSQRKDTPKADVETQETTKELSFAEIKNLIETGRADLIPNNKTIPDLVNVRGFALYWPIH